MSHSSVDDSLVKNPVSPVILPASGGSEEEEEQEDQWDDDDEDELEDSRDMREDGLFGQEEELEEVEEASSLCRTNASPPAHPLSFPELVSSVRSWKSEKLATLPTRSG